MSFCVKFAKERYNALELENFSFELVNVAFTNLIKKQLIALKDLDEIDTKTEFITYVGNSERNGSCWS